MGPVWLRYLKSCLFPSELSLAYDVPDASSWSLTTLTGYAFVVGSFALCFAGPVATSSCERKLGTWRERLALFAWYFGSLLPVSQILVPLQHRMADRYLCLSVFAPCLVVACCLLQLARRVSQTRADSVALALALPLVLALGALTFERSMTFSDSVLLFLDATVKSRDDSDAPYQLGKALEERGQLDRALLAFREVLRRTEGNPTLPIVRSATNNYARLLAKRGELPQAERALRSALRGFPDDEKLSRNLAKVLRMSGRFAEADAFERGQRPVGSARRGDLEE
jgi:tetratricopeptide (TPR) repeat protein